MFSLDSSSTSSILLSSKSSMLELEDCCHSENWLLRARTRIWLPGLRDLTRGAVVSRVWHVLTEDTCPLLSPTGSGALF